VTGRELLACSLPWAVPMMIEATQRGHTGSSVMAIAAEVPEFAAILWALPELHRVEVPPGMPLGGGYVRRAVLESMIAACFPVLVPQLQMPLVRDAFWYALFASRGILLATIRVAPSDDGGAPS
jgi:hypothetical protein